MTDRNKVIASLDLLLERSLRSKKPTGTRMLALKCTTEMGAGWHTCGEVLERMKAYVSAEKLKVDYVFELAAKYPTLVQTEISPEGSVMDSKVKIKDEAYPIVRELIDKYVDLLKSGA